MNEDTIFLLNEKYQDELFYPFREIYTALNSFLGTESLAFYHELMKKHQIILSNSLKKDYKDVISVPTNVPTTSFLFQLYSQLNQKEAVFSSSNCDTKKVIASTLHELWFRLLTNFICGTVSEPFYNELQNCEITIQKSENRIIGKDVKLLIFAFLSLKSHLDNPYIIDSSSSYDPNTCVKDYLKKIRKTFFDIKPNDNLKPNDSSFLQQGCDLARYRIFPKGE